jgi:hypothetical protein
VTAGRPQRRHAINRLQRMPLASRLAPRWRPASATHSWITVLPGERVLGCVSAWCVSDGVIACEQYLNRTVVVSNMKFHQHLFAPRPRLERGTYCLGGTFEAWPGGAGYRLTCCLAVVAMAGYGLARPRACGRWLPVWLPVILLATLMSECPGDLTVERPAAVFHDENRGWRPTD